jgi:adenine-specific DNA glycosylase
MRLERSIHDYVIPPPPRGQCGILQVWVSEIMLQQTRVETVIPYYRKWIEAFVTTRRSIQVGSHSSPRFPTVEALSNSNIEAVNALWKGAQFLGTRHFQD